MNHTELERRLGEVLRQHAEDTMDSTDTQTRLETLERELERNRPRIRIGWVAGAVAAAAVVAALVVVDASRDGGTDTPAGPVDDGAATELASDFTAALAAYDADLRSVVPRGRRRHPAPDLHRGRRVDGSSPALDPGGRDPADPRAL